MKQTLDVEHEIADLTARIGEEAEQRNGDQRPLVDVGADNMVKAGELAARALQEVAAEAARRVLALGETIMAEARERETYCKEFSGALTEHANQMASESTDFFQRIRTAAIALMDLRRAVEARGSTLPKKVEQ